MGQGITGTARLPAAYRGSEPYVFVCYSHHDSDAVHADLARLRGIGLRIWYDEGISPGSEWSEELAQALEGAELVLFYATERSANSRHCRDEINFAHNHDKSILPIFLEDVSLPKGLELSLSSTQAVLRFRLDEDHYLEKLRSVLPVATIGESASTRSDAHAPVSPALETRQATGPRRPVGLAVAILAIAALAAVLLDRDALIARWVMFRADHLGSPMEQQVGFGVAADGTRIAYAVTGEGPPILIVLGWATHLETGFNSPTYDGLGVLALTSEHHRVIRYDGRGFGLSDRDIDDFSLEARVSDIEAVVAAAGLDRFALYALSAGGPAGIAYAHRHPEKVVSLTLASSSAAPSEIERTDLEAFLGTLDVVEAGYDRSESSVNLFTEVLFPDADGPTREIFREFLRRSARGTDLVGFFRGYMEENVNDLAETLTVPTYVIHGQDDRTIPLERGRRMASLIPGARFEIVPGGHPEGTGQTPETRRKIIDFIDEIYARERAEPSGLPEAE
ncbi:MAG: alpha/beta fold hydrolase [Pseudomonadales bacterium]|nr:alpha/beta fold hydrolase [Pseudomonadales bacterium]